MALSIALSAMHNLITDTAPQALDEELTYHTTLWDRLQKRGPSNAKGPQYSITKTKNTSAGAFYVGEDMRAAGGRTFDKAKGEFGNYMAAIEFADKQLKEIAASGSELELPNLVTEELEAAVQKLAEEINADAFTGTGDNGLGKTIVGLTTAIADDNTYMGIDRNTAGLNVFKPYVNENSGTLRSISITLLRTLYNEAVHQRKAKLSVAFCSPELFDSVADLAGVTTEAPVASGAAVSKFIDMGQAFYKGIPFVVVPEMPANRIDFVDERNLYFELLGGLDVKPPQVKSDIYRTEMYIYPQLVLRNPHKSAASLQDVQ